jgi:hypothetical protein
MTCDKCGYIDKKEVEKFGKKLCIVCNTFSPESEEDFLKYIEEKIDWKDLETFRKYNQSPGSRQKEGMTLKAKEGKLVTRPALGYNFINGELIPNEFSSKVHSIFKVYLEKNYSLNSMAKYYGLSVNGLKKILTNRTYLGEIKFAGQLHQGTHRPIVSQELFYAVQRKLSKD